MQVSTGSKVSLPTGDLTGKEQHGININVLKFMPVAHPKLKMAIETWLEVFVRISCYDSTWLPIKKTKDLASRHRAFKINIVILLFRLYYVYNHRYKT